MEIVDELSSVWRRIGELESTWRNSRNMTERKELTRDIKSLRARLTGLQRQLDQDTDADPCQTPDCDGKADLEPNRCVKCADQEVEDGI